MSEGPGLSDPGLSRNGLFPHSCKSQRVFLPLSDSLAARGCASPSPPSSPLPARLNLLVPFFHQISWSTAVSRGKPAGGRRDPSVLCMRRILKSPQVLSDPESPRRKMFSALVKVPEKHFSCGFPFFPCLLLFLRNLGPGRGGQQWEVTMQGLQAVRNWWPRIWVLEITTLEVFNVPPAPPTLLGVNPRRKRGVNPGRKCAMGSSLVLCCQRSPRRACGTICIPGAFPDLAITLGTAWLLLPLVSYQCTQQLPASLSPSDQGGHQGEPEG